MPSDPTMQTLLTPPDSVSALPRSSSSGRSETNEEWHQRVVKGLGNHAIFSTRTKDQYKTVSKDPVTGKVKFAPPIENILRLLEETNHPIFKKLSLVQLDGTPLIEPGELQELQERVRGIRNVFQAYHSLWQLIRDHPVLAKGDTPEAQKTKLPWLRNYVLDSYQMLLDLENIELGLPLAYRRAFKPYLGDIPPWTGWPNELPGVGLVAATVVFQDACYRSLLIDMLINDNGNGQLTKEFFTELSPMPPNYQGMGLGEDIKNAMKELHRACPAGDFATGFDRRAQDAQARAIRKK